MITINDRLRQDTLKTKMIIQIHDELVFEVPEKELEMVTHLVKEEMENVAELTVPLVVEIHWGKTWDEAH